MGAGAGVLPDVQRGNARGRSRLPRWAERLDPQVKDLRRVVVGCVGAHQFRVAVEICRAAGEGALECREGVCRTAPLLSRRGRARPDVAPLRDKDVCRGVGFVD